MREENILEWNMGNVSVHGISELVIEGDKWRITLSQRDIRLEGISGTVEQFNIQGPNLKHFYIQFDEQLKGFDSKHWKHAITSDSRIEAGFFEVRYTVLGGKLFYITIVPIYGALYGYVVLTPNELYIKTLGRRKIFVQHVKNSMNVYLL
ncbi:MAG: hypothetical protein F7B59_01830 [Desulfurococcales archaeon]|nr:hypothetical protein [Desulfurococcales archaeon]